MILTAVFVCWLLEPSTPLLHERDRFPDQATARENLEIARTYREYLRCKMMGAPSWQHSYWMEQYTRSNWIYQCWDWLHAAQGGEGRDQSYWRRSLYRLRELLGPEAYHAGRMPNIP